MGRVLIFNHCPLHEIRRRLEVKRYCLQRYCQLELYVIAKGARVLISFDLILIGCRDHFHLSNTKKTLKSDMFTNSSTYTLKYDLQSEHMLTLKQYLTLLHFSPEVSRVLLFGHFCDPIDRSMPGLPFPHYLTEFAQVHVHWIGDAIQPFRPLLPSSPSAFSLSQHQGFSQRVCCSHYVAKVWRFSSNRSNEYSRLISFRIDRFDVLAV